MEAKKSFTILRWRVAVLVDMLVVMLFARTFFYLRVIMETTQREDVFWNVFFYGTMITEGVLMVYVMATLNPTQKRRLISHGLYRFIAHPAYLSYMTVDVIFLAGGGWGSALDVMTRMTFWSVIILAAITEEAWLIELTGDEARKYYLRTPSFAFFWLRLCQAIHKKNSTGSGS